MLNNEKLKQYHKQLKQLWDIRQKADDKVTNLLREIKNCAEENQISTGLLEGNRITFDFAFSKQEQHHRVSTFLQLLDQVINEDV